MRSSAVSAISRALGVSCLLTLAAAAPSNAQARSRASAPPSAVAEVRAIWVDAFHAGIRSPKEVAQLVADAKRLHLNTLIVQVRRRGDALYASAIEPPLDDPNYNPAFDALGHVVEAAHAQRLQVHAWINAMSVWRDEAPPRDPRHLFNTHGPGAAGDACWLTSSREGVQKFPVGYFLDPGHPAAQDHLVRVYTDIVRRYKVDGIHFDYIRYPETAEVLPRGSNVGYNAVSVRRFQRAARRTDTPAPDDERWIAWRQQQVTELVRRVSIEARAINPAIKVSAATIAWGRPPTTSADFANTAPSQRVFQNWPAWLAEGLLDLACPMNYAREHDARVREWFNGWMAWEKRHTSGRQLVVGIGGYLNTADNVLAQLARARKADRPSRADGTSIFSYFAPAAASASGNPEAAPVTASAAPDRLDFLVRGAGSVAPAYRRPAVVPAMPWIEQPTTGSLAGTVTGRDGAPVEGAAVQVRRTGVFRKATRLTSDGNGWFGGASFSPGRYRVRVETEDGKPGPTSAVVRVRPGRVARANISR